MCLVYLLLQLLVHASIFDDVVEDSSKRNSRRVTSRQSVWYKSAPCFKLLITDLQIVHQMIHQVSAAYMLPC